VKEKDSQMDIRDVGEKNSSNGKGMRMGVPVTV
jgi:hypothetical protein